MGKSMADILQELATIEASTPAGQPFIRKMVNATGFKWDIGNLKPGTKICWSLLEPHLRNIFAPTTAPNHASRTPSRTTHCTQPTVPGSTDHSPGHHQPATSNNEAPKQPTSQGKTRCSWPSNKPDKPTEHVECNHTMHQFVASTCFASEADIIHNRYTSDEPHHSVDKKYSL